jgi:hypothetical protein
MKLFFFSGQQKIGEVCFVLCLEDWGPITAQQIVVQQEGPQVTRQQH